MLETVIVVVLVLTALAAAAAVRSYRHFAFTRRRFLEHLKAAAPEIDVVGTSDVGFTARVLGSDIEVDFATLTQQRTPGASEHEWFDRLVDRLRSKIPVPGAPPYALIQDRLLPQVKPAGHVEIFDRYPPALRLVWRPFVPGVAITYVINNPHDRMVVTRRTVEVWEVSATTLHRVALKNLREHTAHLLTEIGGPQIRYEHLDGLEATRILVADMLLPSGIDAALVAIPEETAMFIAPESQYAALAAEAAARYAASTRPISPQVFRLSPTGPVPIEPP